MNEQLTRLLKEVAETKGQNASILTFAAGVGDVVRKAVEDALAANPGLTAEDLAAVTQAADDLDAGQNEIAAAIAANPQPGEPPAEPVTPTAAPLRGGHFTGFDNAPPKTAAELEAEAEAERERQDRETARNNTL